MKSKRKQNLNNEHSLREQKRPNVAAKSLQMRQFRAKVVPDKRQSHKSSRASSRQILNRFGDFFCQNVFM